MIIIPALCEIVNVLKSLNTEESIINETATSIHNFGIYIGEAFGPFIGGYLTTKYDFTGSCYFISLLNFLFTVLYVLMNTNLKDLLLPKKENINSSSSDKLPRENNTEIIRTFFSEIKHSPIKRVNYHSTINLDFRNLKTELLNKNDMK